MPSPLGQAVRSSWGPVTVCPTTSIWFTHASPWRVIADDRESILCGGAPPRGLSDETTSLGSWVQRWKGSQPQPFKPSHLDDFCSANNCLTRRAARVWSNRENCKDFERSKLSNSISNPSQGIVFHRFSGGPVTRSKRTHPWMSGVTMLVRWLCSSPASELFPLVGRSTFVLPRPQEMHPSAKKGHVNQQAASFQRPPKKACPGGLAVTGLGKECTLLPR